MLALTIPWLLALLTIAAIVCMIKKKWKVALLLVGVTLALNWWCECIPYRLFRTQQSLCSKAISVMCFNINGSDYYTYENAEQVYLLIKKCNPDVVFISEFANNYSNCLDSLLKIDYQYTTYPNSMCNHYFYSIYPLVNYRRLVGDKEYSPGVFVSDVAKGMDTITILGCHLASNNYTNDRTYLTPDSLKYCKDYINYYHNIKNALSLRRMEIDAIIGELDSTNCSAILMGDFNDVSGSDIMCALERHQLKDAWWEGGVGYGATIHNPLSYRIDHIMYTKGLILQTIKVLCSNGVSDHDALYAVFKY